MSAAPAAGGVDGGAEEGAASVLGVAGASVAGLLSVAAASPAVLSAAGGVAIGNDSDEGDSAGPLTGAAPPPELSTSPRLFAHRTAATQTMIHTVAE